MIIIEGINPEPWRASEASVGRKNGKQFVQFHTPASNRVYKEAIRDAMMREYPEVQPVTWPVTVSFLFWRQLPSYEGTGARQVRKHAADATNLQKALEDALQGFVFENDRQVRRIESEVVEQDWETNPLIVIEFRRWNRRALPAEVRDRLANPHPIVLATNDRDIAVEEVF